jgi:protein SCO1/2
MAGSLVALAVSGQHSGPKMEPIPYFADVAFPDFEGVSQTAAPVDASILDGRVTIVDFFFTHCPAICPEMSSRMMEQAEALKDSNVKFLSISIDPEHDTPEVMAEFAERYDAKPKQWTFVRTPKETLDQVALTIGFAVQESDEQIQVGPDEVMQNLIHPIDIFLIGPDRKIYGRYYFRSEEDLSKLSADAKRLLAQR